MAHSGRKQRQLELDRLLAQGALSGPEKERILGNVLAHGVTSKPRPIWRPVVGAVVVAASAALLLLAVPQLWQGPPTSGAPGSTPKDALRAKGTAVPGPMVELGCQGPCRRGATLMLRVGALATRAHVTAFALRPDGRRIWYLPAAGDTSPKIAATSTPVVLSKGVRIGPEHIPGSYQVHLLLTDRPLRRKDVDTQGKLKPQDVTVHAHVIRSLEVRP